LQTFFQILVIFGSDRSSSLVLFVRTNTHSRSSRSRTSPGVVMPRYTLVETSDLNPEQLTLLKHAAELRADGNSWEQTARQLKTDSAELRRLAEDSGRFFRQIMAKADRAATREGRREATFVLRKQLRIEPGSIGARLSAQCLANIDLTYY